MLVKDPYELCTYALIQYTTLVHAVQQVGKEFDALIIDTSAPQDDPLYDNSDTTEVSSL